MPKPSVSTPTDTAPAPAVREPEDGRHYHTRSMAVELRRIADLLWDADAEIHSTLMMVSLQMDPRFGTDGLHATVELVDGLFSTVPPKYDRHSGHYGTVDMYKPGSWLNVYTGATLPPPALFGELWDDAHIEQAAHRIVALTSSPAARAELIDQVLAGDVVTDRAALVAAIAPASPAAANRATAAKLRAGGKRAAAAVLVVDDEHGVADLVAAARMRSARFVPLTDLRQLGLTGGAERDVDDHAGPVPALPPGVEGHSFPDMRAVQDGTAQDPDDVEPPALPVLLDEADRVLKPIAYAVSDSADGGLTPAMLADVEATSAEFARQLPPAEAAAAVEAYRWDLSRHVGQVRPCETGDTCPDRAAPGRLFCARHSAQADVQLERVTKVDCPRCLGGAGEHAFDGGCRAGLVQVEEFGNVLYGEVNA